MIFSRIVSIYSALLSLEHLKSFMPPAGHSVVFTNDSADEHLHLHLHLQLAKIPEAA